MILFINHGYMIFILLFIIVVVINYNKLLLRYFKFEQF